MLGLWRKRPRSHIFRRISQLTNYSLTLNLLNQQQRRQHNPLTAYIQNKEVHHIIGERIKGILKAIHKSGMRCNMNYILEEKDGKTQCGPIVISTDFGGNKLLNLLKHSNRYDQVEKISDEALSTLKIQSSLVQNKCSFEIFAYPRLNKIDAQEFFGAAMKFLKYTRVSQNSNIPMVQLRQLSSGALKSSVLYYPTSAIDCYKCVLMSDFYYKMFIRKSVDAPNMVAMKPIDISHHLRVADNKNILCIAHVCPSINSDNVKEVLPEAYKIFRLYDKSRTFYVSFTTDQDMSEMIEKAKGIDENGIISMGGILFNEDEIPSTPIVACFRTHRVHISDTFISSTFDGYGKIKSVQAVKGKNGEILVVLVEFEKADDARKFIKSRHSKPGEYLRYALQYPDQGSSVFCDNLDVKNSRLILYDYETKESTEKYVEQKDDENRGVKKE